MPDQLDVTTGTAEESALVGEQTEEQSGDTKATESYLGTYRTKEEAEKGFKEKEETIRRLQSERDKALMTKEIMAQIAENLKMTGGSAQSQDNGAELEAEYKRIAEEMDQGGGQAIAKNFGRFLTRAEQIAEEKATARVQELRAELTAMKERMFDISPEYQAVDREKVQAIQEKYKVPKEVAFQIAKDMTPATRTFGSTGSTYGRSGADKSAVAPEVWARLEADFGPLKPNEKAELAKKWRNG